LGEVQVARPSADCGGIRQTIAIFKRRRGLFPATVLPKATLQCLHPRQQAVMRVRQRKERKEGEGLAATKTVTATDPNPVVMFIVRLLTAASVTDDGISHTKRAFGQDDLVTVSRPVSFKLVRQHRKWDKKNRSSLGLCSR